MSLEKVESRESPLVIVSFAGGIGSGYFHGGQPRPGYHRLLAPAYRHASTPVGSYLAVAHRGGNLGRRGVMAGRRYGPQSRP